MTIKKILALSGFLLTSSLCSAQTTQWEFQRLGFYDSIHTESSDGSSTGRHVSTAEFLNSQGHAAGFSLRYKGLFGVPNGGSTAWFYDGDKLIQLGFTDSDHYLSDSFGSFAQSRVTSLNDAGQVTGISTRYSGPFSPNGESAWVYENNSLSRIGLTGTGYIRSSDGYQSSIPKAQNKQGQILGFSTSHFGTSTQSGSVAWIYQNGSTIKLGLTGNEYIRDDGYRFSGAGFLTESGFVAGISVPHNGSIEIGRDAWIYDSNSGHTTRIGLTGPGYTSTSGSRNSTPEFINENGQVAGYSVRIQGNSNNGQDAWIYNGSGTQRVGLTGSVFSNSSDGYEFHELQFFNSQGKAAGVSQRYNGSTFVGYSAWAYDGNASLEIGLRGGIYTRVSDNSHESTVTNLNESGYVTGTSVSFIGNGYGYGNRGQSAWIYNGQGTVQIGLTGGKYTDSSGYHYSTANLLNNNGQAAGTSNWAIADNNGLVRGTSAWLYDGTGNRQIGLTGSQFTAADGTQGSFVEYINENGQVAGKSVRYNGPDAGSFVGQSAWLYDFNSNQTFEFTLSERSNGTAESQVNYLGEDGLVLGSYTLFGSDDSDLGERLFYFSVETGLFDLGELLTYSGIIIGDQGWSTLAELIRVEDSKFILGHGILDDNFGSQGAFLLTASPVPIPAAGWLMGSALLCLAGIRRRP